MKRILAIAALVAGCEITETGNPELVSLGITARTTAPEQVALGAGRRAAGQVVLESAWVTLGEVDFVRAEVCDTDGERESEVTGPWVVDLVAAPEAVAVDVPAGDYCRVRVDLDRADDALPAGAPAELRDHVLVITGTRGDGAPFTIVSRDKQEADVRSRGAPFPIDAGTEALLLAFDVAAWFDGVPLEDAAPGDDGRVWLADDRNEDLLELFEERVEASLELFEDDGDLSVGDDDAPIAD